MKLNYTLGRLINNFQGIMVNGFIWITIMGASETEPWAWQMMDTTLLIKTILF